jgi:hypothetical protein
MRLIHRLSFFPFIVLGRITAGNQDNRAYQHQDNRQAIIHTHESLQFRFHIAEYRNQSLIEKVTDSMVT